MFNQYQPDINEIIARQHDNGGQLWATTDKRICKGGPFSTLGSALMLSELGCKLPVMKDIAGLIFGLWREDGRFQIAPNTAIYPCHTAGVAKVLCRMGYVYDARLEKTFEHLLNIQHTDGGWRCNSFKYGRGPETEFSNPGTTLESLDAFRFTKYLNSYSALDKAVEFLLDHWEIRKPLGPCHYGIGKLFMQVEYPFFQYNLFFYVYVLSFFNRAKNDSRFLEALELLKSKMVDGKIIVENPNRQLSGLSFCEKGQPSELATRRFMEVEKNLGK